MSPEHLLKENIEENIRALKQHEKHSVRNKMYYDAFECKMMIKAFEKVLSDMDRIFWREKGT
jgi:hypothetical protein